MIWVKKMRHNKDIIPTLFILVFVIVIAVLLAMVSENDAKVSEDMRFISLPIKQIKTQDKRFMIVVGVKDLNTDSIYNDTIRL